MFLIRWWHPSQLDSDAALRNLKGNETQATLPQSETDVTAGRRVESQVSQVTATDPPPDQQR